MSKRREFIVIEPSVVGDVHGFQFIYGWNGVRHKTHEAAVKAGFGSRDSDDFNVAVLEGNKLVDFLWMDQPMNDPEGAAELAKQHGFTIADMTEQAIASSSREPGDPSR